MSRRLRVFICHASQDKPAIRQLYKRLGNQPWIEPWLDERSLLPGQDWKLAIEEAVDTTDVVIVCLSNQSVNKEGFVQREIRYAFEIALEKPEGTIFIIPLRLDDCNVPRSLRSFHYEDYFGNRKERSHTHLLEALKLRFEQITRADENAPQITIADDRSKDGLLGKVFSSPYRHWFASGGIVILILLIMLSRNWFTANTPSTGTPTHAPTSTPPAVGTLTATKTVTPVPPTITPSPTPGIGSTMKGKDGMILVYVPAGEFTMGSEDREEDEKPEHQVYLDAYWIDQTEVTNGMYRKCVSAEFCEKPFKSTSKKRENYYGNPAFDNYPVTYVSWEMAQTYCRWVGRDLPTEAQWEKAARGTDGREYPWGNTQIKPTLLNYQGSALGDTTEVRSYPDGVSPYGAYDMAGNVYEWVSDWYSNTYYQTSPRLNPTGPSSGLARIVRGGAWSHDEEYARSAYRNAFDPRNQYNFGFRCALAVEP